jgi:hypothetical protein
MNTSFSRAVFAGLLAVALFIVGASICLLFSIYFSKLKESDFPQQPRMDTGEYQNASSTRQEDEVDTSDWKTYRNEEFGFEIKIPSEWGSVRIDHIDGKETMYSFQHSGVNVHFQTRKTTSTIQEIRKDIASEYMGVAYEDTDKIILAGWDGYRKVAVYSGQATEGLVLYSDESFLVGNGAYCQLSFSAVSADSHASAVEAAKWEAALKTLKRD